MIKNILCLLTAAAMLALPAYGQDISNVSNLLSDEGKILYGNEPNSILVIDYPANRRRIGDYLKMIDVAPKQVLIEARVVEVKLQGESSLGINWSAFAKNSGLDLGRFTAGETAGQPVRQVIPYKNTNYPPGTTTVAEDPFSLTIFDENINVVLKALANNFSTDILSAPSITSVNNHAAEIKVVRSLPWAEPSASTDSSGSVTVSWTIHFEDVGIALKATPTITEDGNISMDLNPEVSEFISNYELTLTQGGASVPYTVPIIDKRNAKTKVVIGNGKTLIIGGLMEEKKVKGTSKVPFMGDIPGLGWFFKSTKDTSEKTELLIFVSPTIITPSVGERMKKEETEDVARWCASESLTAKLTQLENERTRSVGLDEMLTALENKVSRLTDKRKRLEKEIFLKDISSR